MKADLFTDGGARLNPGLAGIGVVLRQHPAGDIIDEIARPIGTATNNVAEYTALIEGLKLALGHGVTEIHVQVDSPVVAGHLLGTYKIKSKKLAVLVDATRALLNQFESHSFRRGDRSENAYADRLANVGMDSSTASMFTIHLDLPGKNASVTCAKCLEQRQVKWVTEKPAGDPLWDWMSNHASADHDQKDAAVASDDLDVQ